MVLARSWIRARAIFGTVKKGFSDRGVRQMFGRGVQLVRSEGFVGLKRYLLKAAVNYQDWIAANELTDVDREYALLQLENLEAKPLISIVMPVYNSNLEWLEAAISSIQNQVYGNWELCI